MSITQSLRHARRVVQRQPVRHAPAPVVSAQGERGDAQRVHHLNEVLRQGALAVVAVVRQARRVRRIAVAAQVGQDQEEVVPEALRHAVPHRVGLGEAVQQEQRRLAAVATQARSDLRAVHA
jgi:hypothetical protein